MIDETSRSVDAFEGQRPSHQGGNGSCPQDRSRPRRGRAGL